MRPQTRIRKFRNLAGLSTAALGELVGIAQSGISRIEIGRVSISLDVLYRIAVALKVKPGDLLEADDGSAYAQVSRNYDPPNTQIDNSLLARLERFKAETERDVLIQQAIDEIKELRSNLRFVNEMTARFSETSARQ